MARRRSYFPSVDSRFAGDLEPSPRMGSYYNPSRYAGQGFTGRELSGIQRNLANVYREDLEYNRVANPAYQTIQDTGATSTAQFGSGRATPATTRNYINQFGSATPEGNVSFMTPSGGSISFTPQNRGKRVSAQSYLGTPASGGAQPTSSPFAEVLQPSNLSQAYAQGYGAPTPTIQQGPGGAYRVGGGVAAPFGPTNPVNSFFTGVSSLFRGGQKAFANIGASLGRQFFRPQQQMAFVPPTQPRRYFDEE